MNHSPQVRAYQNKPIQGSNIKHCPVIFKTGTEILFRIELVESVSLLGLQDVPWLAISAIMLFIYFCLFILDLAWISPDERCWYNSLWSEAWKYSSMPRVNHFSWHFKTAYFFNISLPVKLEFFFMILIVWSHQKSKLLTLDLHAWKIELFTPTFRCYFEWYFSFTYIMMRRFSISTLLFYIFFPCRAVIIDPLKFFLGTSILTIENISIFLAVNCHFNLYWLSLIPFSCFSTILDVRGFSCGVL